MKKYLFALCLVLMPASWAQTQALPDAPSATLPKKLSRPPADQAATPVPPAPTLEPPEGASPLGRTAAAPPASSARQTAASTPPPVAPAARETTPPDDEPITTIVKRVDEVNVIFTVTDKHGHFIKDMKREDFKVLDNNQPAQSIRGFSAETNLPLRVGLLVDASNSVRDRFRFEQESAIEFLNQVIRPRSDRAFVIGFDTTPEVTQDFTDSNEALSRGVRMLRPGGGTALYDAVYYACRDKLMKTQEQGSVRRAIILLSDGEDNQSRVTREEAIEMAQRAEVIVYAISTNISGVKMRGDKVLERIADATGGQAFFPYKLGDMPADFSQIQNELRSQYALAYKPMDLSPNGQYHSIEILAENHKNYRVRARKGYYAPKQ